MNNCALIYFLSKLALIEMSFFFTKQIKISKKFIRFISNFFIFFTVKKKTLFSAIVWPLTFSMEEPLIYMMWFLYDIRKIHNVSQSLSVPSLFSFIVGGVQPISSLPIISKSPQNPSIWLCLSTHFRPQFYKQAERAFVPENNLDKERHAFSSQRQ